jgi:hypothetical protein
MKKLIIFLVSAFPAVIFAQSNYHEGYVIKNSGDTLKGFINYREWASSPLSIEFKVNEANTEVLKFSPKTIKEFQITGMENYISYSGNISMNLVELQSLPDHLDTSSKKVDVFLQQLETGKNITLYMQSDKKKYRFFIAEKNELPVELKYYPYFFDESRTIEKENSVFKGQFILYINKFNDGDKKLLDNAGRLRYEQSDLEELTAAINGINPGSPASTISVKSRKSLARFFAGIGANFVNTTYPYFQDVYTTTVLPNNGGTLINETVVAKSVQSQTVLPKISIGSDVFLNPNVQQLVFRTEWSLFFNNQSFSVDNVLSNTNDKGVFSLSQLTSTFTPQVLYNVYNKDNFKVYVNIGFALSFATNNNPVMTDSRTGQAITTVYLDNHWSSYPIQIGVLLNKKIEVSLNYDSYGNGLSSKTTLLGVRYFFR